MKKIISLILTLAFLCFIGITVFATEIETVGGKITLTQFIGTDRVDANSVQLYINGQLYTIDTEAFYDIADSAMMLSNIEPYSIENDGIFIGIKDKNGIGSFVFLSSYGADKAVPAAGRELYALYVPQDSAIIDKIIALAWNDSTVTSEWAKDEMVKAEVYKIIPDDFVVADATQPITRENFCILAVKMIEEKIGEELVTENPQYPLEIADTNNVNIKKLYSAGIIKGKEQKKTGVIFAPSDLITREEAATILYRMSEYMQMYIPAIHNVVYYWDEDVISDWALDAVKIMKEMRVMEGINGYEFYPDGTYTVEQAIATMVRLFDI